MTLSQQHPVELNNHLNVDGTHSGPAWLAGLIIRKPRLSLRVVYFYARLGALSRRRRRLVRRLAGTLAGAALLLALSGASVHAATITVANDQVIVEDNGLCSLVEAIANANDTTDGRPYDDCAAGSVTGNDTISLPPAGNFDIPVVDNVLYGATGLPAVDTAITIEGNGAIIQRVSEEPFRLMAVTSTGDLTLNNLTLKHGLADYDYGGAVLAYGNLQVNDCTLSDNTADAGGAIFAYGMEILVTGSSIMNNTAHSGGGLSLQLTTATLEDVTISGSQGIGGRGGGGLYLLEGEISIANSTISGNKNDGGGGGLMVTGATLTLSNTNLIDNESAGGYGGGLYLYGGQTTIEETVISGNAALLGGGFYGYTGNTTLQRSLVAENVATAGGGIMNGKGTITIINSTISGNSAGNGGGVANADGMAFQNVTLIGNVATAGDGGGILNQGASAEVVIRRSLIAGNSASGQGREAFHDGKSITASQFNLLGFSDDGGLAGFTLDGESFIPSQALASVIVTSLADNGGPTQTHWLPSDSPAIDQAPSEDCTAAPVGGVDQRGQPRNQDANSSPSVNECDIGAIEMSGTLLERWEVFIPTINR